MKDGFQHFLLIRGGNLFYGSIFFVLSSTEFLIIVETRNFDNLFLFDGESQIYMIEVSRPIDLSTVESNDNFLR